MFNVVVIDLAVAINSEHAYESDAFVVDNTFKWARFDYINKWNSFVEGDYVEYAYFGIADTIDHVKTALTKLGELPTMDSCSHGKCFKGFNSLAVFEKVDDDTHKATCALCGKVISTENHAYTIIEGEGADGKHAAKCVCGAAGTVNCIATVDVEWSASSGKYEGKCVCGADAQASVKIAIDASEFHVRKPYYSKEWVTGISSDYIEGYTDIVTSIAVKNDDGTVSYKSVYAFPYDDKNYPNGVGEAFKDDLLKGNKVSGQYLIITVKGKNVDDMQFYASSAGGLDVASTVEVELTGINEKTWTTFVVDLSKCSSVSGETNVINYLRIDYFNGSEGHQVGDYIEFGTIGIIDTLDAAPEGYVTASVKTNN